MKKQTDFDKLQEIFKNQAPKTIENGDWDNVRDTFSVSKSGYSRLTKALGKRIEVNYLSIAFMFDVKGRFVGISNWKE